jgi:hypothetical protein
LHDEDVHAACALLETDGDLVGALPLDTAVAKLESRIGVCCPVLPLARLVAAATRVVSGRPLGDRVAERGDE